MSAYVAELSTFPVKGAKAHRPEYLNIHKNVGVINDRYYAIRRERGNLDVWASKREFYVCMNTALMAAEQPGFDAGTGTFDRPSRLNQDYLNALATRLRVDGPLDVQETRGLYNLSDTKGAFVSFLNLASLEELSKVMKVTIDPTRFRMNVLLTGLEPFEELTWVDKYPGTREIQIGTCRFRVDDACERCRAINASPHDGTFDLPVLNELARMMRERGYISPHRGKHEVMGILAAPLNNGMIRRGDKVRVLS